MTTIICADCGRAVDGRSHHLCNKLNICDRCQRPVHLVKDTQNGQPWEGWQHDEVADEVFCGLVMRAPDRIAGRADR